MYRGMTTFKCDSCGHKFTAMDLEWQCTVYTAPAKCPKCGSWHTAPWHLFRGSAPVYKIIWKSIDDNQQ